MGTLSEQNRTLLERVWTEEAQKRVPTSFYRTLNIALDAARATALEQVATMHEDKAQECNRLRDPGMANHHRAWAKKVRALAEPSQ